MLSKRLFKIEDELLEAMGFDFAKTQSEYKNKMAMPHIDICSEKLFKMLLLFSANADPNSYQQKTLRMFRLTVFKVNTPATHRISPDIVKDWPQSRLFMQYCRRQNDQAQTLLSQVDSVVRGIIVRRHALRQRVVYRQMIRELFSNIQHFETVVMRTTDANPLEYYVNPCPPLPVPLFAIAPITDQKSLESLPVGGCIVVQNEIKPVTSAQILLLFWGREIDPLNYTIYFKAGEQAYVPLEFSQNATRVDFVALRDSLLAKDLPARQLAFYKVAQSFSLPTEGLSAQEMWDLLDKESLFRVKLVHEYGTELYAQHTRRKVEYRDGEKVIVCTTVKRVAADKGDLLGVASTRESIFEELRGTSASAYDEKQAEAHVTAAKVAKNFAGSDVPYAWILEDIVKNHAAYHRADFQYVVHLWSQIAHEKKLEGGMLVECEKLIKTAYDIARSGGGAQKPGGPASLLADMSIGFRLFKESHKTRHNFEISRPAKMVAFLESLQTFQSDSASYVFLGIRIRRIMQRLGPAKLRAFDAAFGGSSAPPPNIFKPRPAQPAVRPTTLNKPGTNQTSAQTSARPTARPSAQPLAQIQGPQMVLSAFVPQQSSTPNPMLITQAQTQAVETQPATSADTDVPSPKQLYDSQQVEFVNLLKALLAYAKSILAGIQAITLSMIDAHKFLVDEYSLSTAILYSYDALQIITARGDPNKLPKHWLLLAKHVKAILSNAEYVYYSQNRPAAFPLRTLGVLLVPPPTDASELMKQSWQSATETFTNLVGDFILTPSFSVKFLEWPALALLSLPDKYVLCFDNRVYWRDILLIPICGLDFSTLVRLLCPNVFPSELVAAVHALEPPTNWFHILSVPNSGNFWSHQAIALTTITKATNIFLVDQIGQLPPEARNILQGFHAAVHARLEPYSVLASMLQSVSKDYANQEYRRVLLEQLLAYAVNQDKSKHPEQFDIDMTYLPFQNPETWKTAYNREDIKHVASAALSHAILSTSIQSLMALLTWEKLWRFMVQLYTHAKQLLQMIEEQNSELLKNYLQTMNATKWTWLELIPGIIKENELYSSDTETEHQTKITDLPLTYQKYDDGTFTATYSLALQSPPATASSTACPTAEELKSYLRNSGDHTHDTLLDQAHETILRRRKNAIDYGSSQGQIVCAKQIIPELFFLTQDYEIACMLYAAKHYRDLVSPHEITALDDERVQRALASEIGKTYAQSSITPNSRPPMTYKHFPAPSAMAESTNRYLNYMKQVIEQLMIKLSTVNSLYPSLTAWCRTLLEADLEVVKSHYDDLEIKWNIVDNIALWLLADPQSLTLEKAAELLNLHNAVATFPDSLRKRLYLRSSPKNLLNYATNDMFGDFEKYYTYNLQLADAIKNELVKLANAPPKDCSNPDEYVILVTQSRLLLEFAIDQQGHVKKIVDDSANNSLISPPDAWPLSRPFRPSDLQEIADMLQRKYTNQYFPLMPDAFVGALLKKTTQGNQSAFAAKLPATQYRNLYMNASTGNQAVIKRWQDEKEALKFRLKQNPETSLFYLAIALYRAIVLIVRLQEQTLSSDSQTLYEKLAAQASDVLGIIKDVSTLHVVFLIITDHIRDYSKPDVATIERHGGIVSYISQSCFTDTSKLISAFLTWKMYILDQPGRDPPIEASVPTPTIDQSILTRFGFGQQSDVVVVYPYLRILDVLEKSTEKILDTYQVYMLLSCCNKIVMTHNTVPLVGQQLSALFAPKIQEDQSYLNTFAKAYFDELKQSDKLVKFFAENYLSDNFFVENAPAYQEDTSMQDDTTIDAINDLVIPTETEDDQEENDIMEEDFQIDHTLHAMLELVNLLILNHKYKGRGSVVSDLMQGAWTAGVVVDRLTFVNYTNALGSGFSLETEFGGYAPSDKVLWQLRKMLTEATSNRTRPSLYTCSINLLFCTVLIAMKAFARTKHFTLVHHLAVGYQKLVVNWQVENFHRPYMYGKSGMARGACSFETIAALDGLLEPVNHHHKSIAMCILNSIDLSTCWYIPASVTIENMPLEDRYHLEELRYGGMPHALMSIKTSLGWSETAKTIPSFAKFCEMTRLDRDGDGVTVNSPTKDFENRFRVLFGNFEKNNPRLAIDDAEFARQYCLLYLEILLSRLKRSKLDDITDDKTCVKWWTENVILDPTLSEYKLDDLSELTDPKAFQGAVSSKIQRIVQNSKSNQNLQGQFENDTKAVAFSQEIINHLSPQARDVLLDCIEKTTITDCDNYTRLGADFYAEDDWIHSSASDRINIVRECALYYAFIFSTLTKNLYYLEKKLQECIQIIREVYEYFNDLIQVVLERDSTIKLVRKHNIRCLQDISNAIVMPIDVCMVWEFTAAREIVAWTDLDLVRTCLSTKVQFAIRILLDSEASQIDKLVDDYQPDIESIEGLVGQISPNYESKVFPGFYNFAAQKLSPEQLAKVEEFAKAYYLRQYDDLFSHDYDPITAGLDAFEEFATKNKTDSQLVCYAIWAVAKSKSEDMPLLAESVISLDIYAAAPSIIESQKVLEMIGQAIDNLGQQNSKKSLSSFVETQIRFALGPLWLFANGLDYLEQWLFFLLKMLVTNGNSRDIHASYHVSDPEFEFSRYIKVLNWITLFLAQRHISSQSDFDLVHVVALWYDSILEKDPQHNKTKKTYTLTSLYPSSGYQFYYETGSDGLRLQLLGKAMLLKDTALSISRLETSSTERQQLVDAINKPFADQYFLQDSSSEKFFDSIRHAQSPIHMRFLALVCNLDESHPMNDFVAKPTQDLYLQILEADGLSEAYLSTFARIGADHLGQPQEGAHDKYQYIRMDSQYGDLEKEMDAVQATIYLLNGKKGTTHPPKKIDVEAHEKELVSILTRFDSSSRESLQRDFFAYTNAYDVLSDTIDSISTIVGQYWSQLPPPQLSFDGSIENPPFGVNVQELVKNLAHIQIDPQNPRPILTLFATEEGKQKIRNAYLNIFSNMMMRANGVDVAIREVGLFILCVSRWFERSRNLFIQDSSDQITLAPVIIVIEHLFNEINLNMGMVYKIAHVMYTGLNMAFELALILDTGAQTMDVVNRFCEYTDIDRSLGFSRQEVMELVLHGLPVIYNPITFRAQVSSRDATRSSAAFQILKTRLAKLPRATFNILLGFAKESNVYLSKKYDLDILAHTSNMSDSDWRVWSQHAWHFMVSKYKDENTTEHEEKMSGYTQQDKDDPLQSFVRSTYHSEPFFNAGTMQRRWVGCEASEVSKATTLELQGVVTRSTLWCIKEALYSSYNTVRNNDYKMLFLWYPDLDVYEPSNCVSYELRNLCHHISSQLKELSSAFSVEAAQNMWHHLQMYEKKRADDEKLEYEQEIYRMYGPDMFSVVANETPGLVFDALHRIDIRALHMVHPNAIPAYPYKNPCLGYIMKLQNLCLEFCRQVCDMSYFNTSAKISMVANVLSCVNKACTSLFGDYQKASTQQQYYYVDSQPRPCKLLVSDSNGLAEITYKADAVSKHSDEKKLVDDLKNMIEYMRGELTDSTPKSPRQFSDATLLKPYEPSPGKRVASGRGRTPGVLKDYFKQSESNQESKKIVENLMSQADQDMSEDEIIWHLLAKLLVGENDETLLDILYTAMPHNEQRAHVFSIISEAGDEQQRGLIAQAMFNATCCAHSAMTRYMKQNVNLTSSTYINVVGSSDHIIVLTFERVLKNVANLKNELAEASEESGAICGHLYPFSKTWSHACQRLLLEHLAPHSVSYFETQTSRKTEHGVMLQEIIDGHDASHDQFLHFVVDLRRQANRTIENREVLDALIDTAIYAKENLTGEDGATSGDDQTKASQILAMLSCDRKNWVDYDALDLFSKHVCKDIQEIIEDDMSDKSILTTQRFRIIEGGLFSAPESDGISETTPEEGTELRKLYDFKTKNPKDALTDDMKKTTTEFIAIQSLDTSMDEENPKYLVRSCTDLVWRARRQASEVIKLESKDNSGSSKDTGKIAAQWYNYFLADNLTHQAKVKPLPLADVNLVTGKNDDTIKYAGRAVALYEIFDPSNEYTTKERHEQLISHLASYEEFAKQLSASPEKPEFVAEFYDVNTWWGLGMLPSIGVAHAVGCAVHQSLIELFKNQSFSAATKGRIGALFIALIYLAAKRLSMLPVTVQIVNILEGIKNTTNKDAYNMVVEAYERAIERANVPIFDGCSYCSLRLFSDGIMVTGVRPNYLNLVKDKHRNFWASFGQIHKDSRDKDDPVAAETMTLAEKWKAK